MYGDILHAGGIPVIDLTVVFTEWSGKTNSSHGRLGKSQNAPFSGLIGLKTKLTLFKDIQMEKNYQQVEFE